MGTLGFYSNWKLTKIYQVVVWKRKNFHYILKNQTPVKMKTIVLLLFLAYLLASCILISGSKLPEKNDIEKRDAEANPEAEPREPILGALIGGIAGAKVGAPILGAVAGAGIGSKIRNHRLRYGYGDRGYYGGYGGYRRPYYGSRYNYYRRPYGHYHRGYYHTHY